MYEQAKFCCMNAQLCSLTLKFDMPRKAALHSEKISQEESRLVKKTEKETSPVRLVSKAASNITEQKEKLMDGSEIASIYNAVSEDKKAKIIDAILKIQSEPPPLPKVGGEYERYTPNGDIDPFEVLHRQWGTWLKYYNKNLDRDYMGQKQLRERDPSLFYALSYRLRIGHKLPLKSIKSIIPSASILTDQEAENLTSEKIEEAKKIRSTMIARP